MVTLLLALPVSALHWYCASQHERTHSRSTWPEIAPVEGRVEFPDGKAARFRLVIHSVAGKALYLLQCHNIGFEGDPDFDYSGDFECRLSSFTRSDTYSTLLTENPQQSRDWESRGRFLLEEISGACGDYPEYGRQRSFRLRGMRLTLSVNDVHFDPRALDSNQGPVREGASRFRSFRFTYRVEPDPDARGEIAEAPAFEDPLRADPSMPGPLRRNCTKVVRRK